MTAIDTAFLDRDGVINEKAPEGEYVTSWDEFRFLPGAVEALRDLRASGVRLILVTNQRGIARGLVSRQTVDDIHTRMNDVLRTAGAEFDAIFVCPHEAGTCDCRKPLPGMFLAAAERFPELEFSNAAVIGDALSDLVPGATLGTMTFLVGSEYSVARIRESAREQDVPIDGWAPSLAALVASGRLPVGVAEA